MRGKGQGGPQLEHLRALRSGDVECGLQKLHGLACRAPHQPAHRRQPVHFSGEISVGVRVHQLSRSRELALGLCTVSPEEQDLSQHGVELRQRDAPHDRDARGNRVVQFGESALDIAQMCLRPSPDAAVPRERLYGAGFLGNLDARLHRFEALLPVGAIPVNPPAKEPSEGQ